MPRPRCSVCLEPADYKMANAIWAWKYRSGDHQAFKQRFHALCFGGVHKLIKDSRSDYELCKQCSEDLGDEWAQVIYGYIYMPGRERINIAFEVHQKCMNAAVEVLKRNAERLPERSSGVGEGGPPPRPQADPWEEVRAMIPEDL